MEKQLSISCEDDEELVDTDLNGSSAQSSSGHLLNERPFSFLGESWLPLGVRRWQPFSSPHTPPFPLQGGVLGGGFQSSFDSGGGRDFPSNQTCSRSGPGTRVCTGGNVFFLPTTYLRSSCCCFVLLQVTLPTFMPSKHTRLGNRMQGRNGDRLGQAGGKGRPSGQRAWRAIWGAIWATAPMPASRSLRPAAQEAACRPYRSAASNPRPPIQPSNHAQPWKQSDCSLVFFSLCGPTSERGWLHWLLVTPRAVSVPWILRGSSGEWLQPVGVLIGQFVGRLAQLVRLSGGNACARFLIDLPRWVRGAREPREPGRARRWEEMAARWLLVIFACDGSIPAAAAVVGLPCFCDGTCSTMAGCMFPTTRERHEMRLIGLAGWASTMFPQPVRICCAACLTACLTVTLAVPLRRTLQQPHAVQDGSTGEGGYTANTTPRGPVMICLVALHSWRGAGTRIESTLPSAHPSTFNPRIHPSHSSRKYVRTHTYLTQTRSAGLDQV